MLLDIAIIAYTKYVYHIFMRAVSFVFIDQFNSDFFLLPKYHRPTIIISSSSLVTTYINISFTRQSNKKINFNQLWKFRNN